MEQLFGSKTRVKLLKLFMSNPNRSFYVREITRKIEEQINSVRRELSNMLGMGIITSDSTNNKLYYEVNQSHEHYEALKLLFTGKKPRATQAVKTKSGAKEEQVDDKETKKKDTTSVATETVMADEKVWGKIPQLDGLLYSGVFTRENNSPVDIMIIGGVSVKQAETAIVDLENEKNTELRYAIMTPEEWQYRKQVNDKFYGQVMGGKKQIVKDTKELFTTK